MGAAVTNAAPADTGGVDVENMEPTQLGRQSCEWSVIVTGDKDGRVSKDLGQQFQAFC